MPTDTTIATTLLVGRQDGAFTSSTLNNQLTGTAEAADVSPANSVSPLISPSQAELLTDRQDLAVRDQELPPGQQPADEETLQKAVSDITAYVQNLQRDLQFRVDTELGQTVVSVVDSETKEVIRQIPSEDVLARARFIEERAAADGLLLQVKI
ncbi:MAG: hypothetical protein BMS9Abin08_1405 [Gammaproteobacteria bacterium]|nr:MAG: hypothetical protein BMS9Abin08_1405 [Gammaproteobacteria bacterium]